MQHVTVIVDRAKIYETIESLYEDADLVFEGVVLHTENIPRKEGTPKTRSQVKVNRIIKSNKPIKEGDILTFMESGGLARKGDIAYGGKPEALAKESRPEEMIPVYFNGVAPMKQGDRVILFANYALDFIKRKSVKIEEGQPIPDNYMIVGGSDGKFYLNGNRAIRKIGEMDGHLGEGKMLSALDMPIDELIKRVSK